eukprot:8554511-Alexandrium_andersonii.AAC.1
MCIRDRLSLACPRHQREGERRGWATTEASERSAELCGVPQVLRAMRSPTATPRACSGHAYCLRGRLAASFDGALLSRTDRRVDQSG